jgi:hypothetical protein
LNRENFLWAHSTYSSRGFPGTLADPDAKAPVAAAAAAALTTTEAKTATKDSDDDKEEEDGEGDAVAAEAAAIARRDADDRAEEAKDATRIIGCMMPFLDFTNHRYRHQITWLRVTPTPTDVDQEPCVVYESGEAIASGDEVFNNYGGKGNEEFLMGYGFCLADNVEDEFAVQLSTASLGPLHQRVAHAYRIEYAHYLRYYHTHQLSAIVTCE